MRGKSDHHAGQHTQQGQARQPDGGRNAWERQNATHEKPPAAIN